MMQTNINCFDDGNTLDFAGITKDQKEQKIRKARLIEIGWAFVLLTKVL